MTRYQFHCFNCGLTQTAITRNPPICPSCGAPTKRDWSFNSQNSMPEHFNNSLGQYVNNERQFKDGLKRKSDEASERMGHTVDLQPIPAADMADAKAHGVTDEGLDATRRATFSKD